jgi:hypothetical protein
MPKVYGAEVSNDTISRITDRFLEEMSDWQNRPLDRVYPVVFIDALVVKIRDGHVTNRPAGFDESLIACPFRRAKPAQHVRPTGCYTESPSIIVRATGLSSRGLRSGSCVRC